MAESGRFASTILKWIVFGDRNTQALVGDQLSLLLGILVLLIGTLKVENELVFSRVNLASSFRSRFRPRPAQSRSLGLV